jgi:hypothetical protein
MITKTESANLGESKFIENSKNLNKILKTKIFIIGQSNLKSDFSIEFLLYPYSLIYQTLSNIFIWPLLSSILPILILQHQTLSFPNAQLQMPFFRPSEFPL